MILGVGGQTMSKSCPMTRFRLISCHKHVFLGPKTHFLRVLMAVKDCPAIGNHLRRGMGITQKVQFYTFLHILTSQGWNLTPRMKIWPQGQNFDLHGKLIFDPHGRKSILGPEIDPPRGQFKVMGYNFNPKALILLSLAKFTPINDQFLTFPQSKMVIYRAKVTHSYSHYKIPVV